MSNGWGQSNNHYEVKIFFEKKIPDPVIRGLINAVTIEVSCKENEYAITIRNNQHASVAAHIVLTKEEFNHIAYEIYKIWEPMNVVDALNKCGHKGA